MNKIAVDSQRKTNLPKIRANGCTIFEIKDKWLSVTMEFFSQMTNRIWLKFCVLVPFTIGHIHTRNQSKWMHWYQDKDELAVGYDGQFLQNYAMDWREIYRGCSSRYNAYALKILCDLDERCLRYVHFKFLTNWLLKN